MKKNVFILMVFILVAMSIFSQNVVLDPNPPVNSEDDFEIIQNAQGGITITKYRGTRNQVVIPATISGIRVTEISGAYDYDNDMYVGAFQRISYFRETSRGLETRYTNPIIYSVVIPNGVITIGEYAFAAETQMITEIVIPNSVTSIGQGAFRSNTQSHQNTNERGGKGNLKKVTFGSGLQSIGRSAFSTNQISEINFPASLKTIGYAAFYKNEIKSLTIPNGVTSIGEWAFEGNPIETLVIPASLRSFERAFASDPYNYNGGIGPPGYRGVLETITAITLPANVSDDNLYTNFMETLLNFYKSQNKRAGTYTWNGRIWTVR